MKLSKNLRQEENIRDSNHEQGIINNQNSSDNEFDIENSVNKIKKKLVCKYCEKEFDFQSALDKHIRIHTGEKPFVCDFEGCKVSFAQVSNLIRHKRTHTGEKPFKCQLCEKTFTSTSNLKLHMKSHMDAPKEKLFCFLNNCQRFYFSLETLKKHLQKSHKKEYDILKEEHMNKNFNQIYNILKNSYPENKKTLDFINFKENQIYIKNKNKENMIIYEESSEYEEEEINEFSDDYNSNPNNMHLNNSQFRENNLINKTSDLNINHNENGIKECNSSQNAVQNNSRVIPRNNKNVSVNSTDINFKKVNHNNTISKFRENEKNMIVNKYDEGFNDIDLINRISCEKPIFELKNNCENFKFDNYSVKSNQIIKTPISDSPRSVQSGISNTFSKNSKNIQNEIIKSKFVSTNINDRENQTMMSTNNTNINNFQTSHTTDLQNLKGGIFKLSNNNITNSKSINSATNNHDKQQLNLKVIPENSKKYIFNSIHNLANSSLSTNNTYTNNQDNTYSNVKRNVNFGIRPVEKFNPQSVKFIANNMTNMSNINGMNSIFGMNNLNTNGLNQNNSIIENLMQFKDGNTQGLNPFNNMKSEIDPNSNLNRYLENSINNIILNLFAKSSQTTNQNQISKSNNINNLNGNIEKANLFNQIDIMDLFKNKSDFINLSANFGNVFMNSLIEAFRQNDILNTNMIKGNLKSMSGKFEYEEDRENDEYFDEDKKEKKIFFRNNLVNCNTGKLGKLKYPDDSKMDLNRTSSEGAVSPKKKKKKSSSNSQNQNNINDNKNYVLKNENLEIPYENKMNYQNFCLKLNEDSSYNRMVKYNDQEISEEEQQTMQKSARSVKRNKLYDTKVFEMNGYRKSLGKKRMLNPANIKFSNKNFKQELLNEQIFNEDQCNRRNQLILNQESHKLNMINKSRSKILNVNLEKTLPNNINYNTSKINFEEEIKVPRQRFESEICISNRNLDPESTYNLNPSNYCDETLLMNYPNINLGNLGARYIFTPNDQSEITEDLYNPEFQDNNYQIYDKTKQNEDSLTNGYDNKENNLSGITNSNNYLQNVNNFKANLINSVNIESSKNTNLNVNNSNAFSSKKKCCKRNINSNTNPNSDKFSNFEKNINLSNNPENESKCCKNKQNNHIKEIPNENKIIGEDISQSQNRIEHPSKCKINKYEEQNYENIPNNNKISINGENNAFINLQFSQNKSAFENKLKITNYNKQNLTDPNTIGYSYQNSNMNQNYLETNENLHTLSQTNNNALSYNTSSNNKNKKCCKSKKPISKNSKNMKNQSNLSYNSGCCQSNSSILKFNKNLNKNEEMKNQMNDSKDEENYNKVQNSLKKSFSGKNFILNNINEEQKFDNYNYTNHDSISYNKSNNIISKNNSLNHNQNINSAMNVSSASSTNVILALAEISENATKIEKNENVVVPVFRKNTSNVKVFKPIMRNKEAIESFDRINNFLAPINLTNYSGPKNSNLNDFNGLGTLSNFTLNKSNNSENHFSDNKRYPQLCSKNLYIDSHNLEGTLKIAPVKKIIRNDSTSEDKFMDKKCIEICGDLLICPELLPINCQKYQNRECDCVEKCKEKDSIYREFIASNKALADLEF